MRVLLTGGSGFLGHHVMSLFDQLGIDVVQFGRTGVKNGSSGFIKADLLEQADYSGIMERIKPTHLLHLAWFAGHGQYWTSPLNYRWVEATTRVVAAFCEAGGQKVVIAGTCAEYNWNHGYCLEDKTPLEPATLYGVAKDVTRRLIDKLCCDLDVPFAWGRVFMPTGFGEDKRRLIPALIDVFRGRRAPFGVDADAFRDILHASDVAEGFLALLLTDAYGAFNISSGQPTRIREIVEVLATLHGANPRMILDLDGKRANEPRLLVGDSQKLHGAGWMINKSSIYDILQSNT